MAEDLTEQRLAALEKARIQQQDIVQNGEKKLDELTGAVRSIQVQQTMIDARLGAVDARLSAVESRIGALSQDVIVSSRQQAEEQARGQGQVNARFDRIDQTLRDILTGNGQQAEVMTNVLATLARLVERLPEKTGE